MVDLDPDFTQSWYDFADRELTFLEPWESAWPPPPSPVHPDNLSDRIEWAAAAAWYRFANGSGTVVGSAAFDAIRELYFALRNALFQHGRRNSFTKEECAVLLAVLSLEVVPARGHRQPANVLLTQLKEALARVPIFQTATLQEAAKKCAHEVLGRRHEADH
jgi:hypothetical protein